MNQEDIQSYVFICYIVQFYGLVIKIHFVAIRLVWVRKKKGRMRTSNVAFVCIEVIREIDEWEEKTSQLQVH